MQPTRRPLPERERGRLQGAREGGHHQQLRLLLEPGDLCCCPGCLCLAACCEAGVVAALCTLTARRDEAAHQGRGGKRSRKEYRKCHCSC